MRNFALIAASAFAMPTSGTDLGSKFNSPEPRNQWAIQPYQWHLNNR